MTTPTDSLYVVTEALYNLLDLNRITLGLEAVYYGDMRKIPKHPAATVYPNEKARELVGAPRKIRNTLEVFVQVFATKVEGSIQDNQREADQMSEAVEALIHQDPTLDGLVTHCMVVRNEAGYLTRDNSRYRGNRLTVQAQSTTLLPMRPGYNQ